MRHARLPDTTIPGGRGAQEFSFSAEATGGQVRNALAGLTSHLKSRDIIRSTIELAELLVCEALKNVAEHAYVDETKRPFRLRAVVDWDEIRVTIEDRGQPMPGLEVPSSHMPAFDTELEQLPEGGFGWALLRDNSRFVKYERCGSSNRLHLCIAREP